MIGHDIILQVKNIRMSYGDFPALQGVSLEVREGSIVSIIGANGAGKSTLLNTISGLLKPLSGTITLRDKRIDGWIPSKIVEEGLSLVPEGGRTFPRMTVLENLIMGSYTASARKKKNKQMQKVYDLFPILAERSKQSASSLSGGQRQMLAIGRALMSDPKVLLFDEISLGLAPVVIKEIYGCIKEINREGTTIILVEQDVKRSLRTSENSYVMLGGKAILSGKSTELSEDEVRKAYFGV